jgi:hypothetical protein
MSLASQKQGIHLYHLGLYTDPNLLEWWKESYQQLDIGRLDMGKSCIRLRKIHTIPYELIRELATKITAIEWIGIYEQSRIISKK